MTPKLGRLLLVAAVLSHATGCGSSSDGGPPATGGSAGAGGGAGGAGASGGAAGAASGGAAGGGGSAGTLAGGTGGGSAVLFRDDFDAPNPAWQFDAGDPEATYSVKGGVLEVKGGFLQAFAFLPIDPSWGDDVEVRTSFRLVTGMVGGAVVRADTASLNAVNCNLREDLDQLRGAQHVDRTYMTLGDKSTPVANGTSYEISARIIGSTLTCTEVGGPTLDIPNVSFASGAVGLFVYQGTVEFDWYEVRKATP